MDGWDYTLLAIAAYFAIMGLVRRMRERRTALMEQLAETMEAERKRLSKLKKKKQKREQAA